jgi:hypothetical protein
MKGRKNEGEKKEKGKGDDIGDCKLPSAVAREFEPTHVHVCTRREKSREGRRPSKTKGRGVRERGGGRETKSRTRETCGFGPKE